MRALLGYWKSFLNVPLKNHDGWSFLRILIADNCNLEKKSGEVRLHSSRGMRFDDV